MLQRHTVRSCRDARRVVNVGAGASGYEPPDLDVVAVEPSAVMRAQRPSGAAPCVAARADVLTWDPAVFETFWLVAGYLPSLLDTDRRRFPATLADQMQALGADRVETVPIPHDCSDGFLGAHWRSPHCYLDATVRRGMSVFAKTPAEDVANGLARLAQDLRSGAWADRHHDLLDRAELDLGYRLLVAG